MTATLTNEEAALFYRAYWPALAWLNDVRRVVAPFPKPTAERPISPALANPLRKLLWAEPELLERFLVEGTGELGDAERALAASWRHRVSGNFVALRHLQKHSIFLKSSVGYAVHGIYSPLEELIQPVPKFIVATLLPFRDRIISDGLIESHAMTIGFGPGARRMMEDEYRAAKQAGIRTSLGEVLALPAKAKAKTKAKAKATVPTAENRLRGIWRITETEVWRSDALDLVGPAAITLDGCDGTFAMLRFEADVDCCYGERDGKPLVEFTFEGDDDGTPRSGRAWATLEDDDTLRGRLFFHRADASDFVAERFVAARRRRR